MTRTPSSTSHMRTTKAGGERNGGAGFRREEGVRLIGFDIGRLASQVTAMVNARKVELTAVAFADREAP